MAMGEQLLGSSISMVPCTRSDALAAARAHLAGGGGRPIQLGEMHVLLADFKQCFDNSGELPSGPAARLPCSCPELLLLLLLLVTKLKHTKGQRNHSSINALLLSWSSYISRMCQGDSCQV